jgi:hypothetical protein
MLRSTALAESPENSLLQSESRPDGSNEESALVLNLKPGERIPLNLHQHAQGFARFTVDFPMTLVLKIRGANDVELQTCNTKPRVTIPAVRNLAEGFVILTYTLAPAEYLVKLRCVKSPNISCDGTEVQVANLAYTSAVFPLSLGSKTLVHLDSISRSASWKMHVSKRSFITFSVSDAPKRGQWERPIGVVVRTLDGDSVEAVESSAFEDEQQHGSFVLPSGDYYVQADASSNEFPQPLLKDSLQKAEIVLRVDELVEQELPQSILILQTWLGEVGLKELMEVSELFDLRNFQRGLPRANKRFASQLAEAAIDRSSVSAPASAFRKLQAQIANKKRIDWPADLKEADRPHVIVSLRPKKDRDVFKATEKGFEEKYNVGLWYRILDKISASEGISANRVVVFVPVWCDPNLVYLEADHTARRHGSTCNSSSVSRPLIAASNVTTAATTSLESKPFDLAASVPSFLESFMKPALPRFEFLTTESDFIEVIVRGLRGHVIRGGPNWERLKFTIAITGGGKTGSSTLRVILDGKIASGLANYPQDADFTRDMEPEFYRNLDEYAKRMADGLSSRLVGSPN